MPPPPPPQDGEVRINDAKILAGNWIAKSGDISILHRFQPDGKLEVSIKGYGIIGNGTYQLEGDLLKLVEKIGECADMTALYEVYGIYEGGELTKLRFVLDGEDACENRRETLDGQIMVATP